MQDVLTIIPGLSGKLGRNDGIGSKKAAFFRCLCDDCPQGPLPPPGHALLAPLLPPPSRAAASRGEVSRSDGERIPGAAAGVQSWPLSVTSVRTGDSSPRGGAKIPGFHICGLTQVSQWHFHETTKKALTKLLKRVQSSQPNRERRLRRGKTSSF